MICDVCEVGNDFMEFACMMHDMRCMMCYVGNDYMESACAMPLNELQARLQKSIQEVRVRTRVGVRVRVRMRGSPPEKHPRGVQQPPCLIHVIIHVISSISFSLTPGQRPTPNLYTTNDRSQIYIWSKVKAAAPQPVQIMMTGYLTLTLTLTLTVHTSYIIQCHHTSYIIHHTSCMMHHTSHHASYMIHHTSHHASYIIHDT